MILLYFFLFTSFLHKFALPFHPERPPGRFGGSPQRSRRNTFSQSRSFFFFPLPLRLFPFGPWPLHRSILPRGKGLAPSQLIERVMVFTSPQQFLLLLFSLPALEKSATSSSALFISPPSPPRCPCKRPDVLLRPAGIPGFFIFPFASLTTLHFRSFRSFATPSS